MLGIDITRISRFENKDQLFVKRILSPNELLEYNASRHKSKFLASRWAIKEALYKSNNKFNKFNKINITKDKKYNYPGYEISTSTEGDYYIAVVQRRQND